MNYKSFKKLNGQAFSLIISMFIDKNRVTNMSGANLQSRKQVKDWGWILF